MRTVIQRTKQSSVSVEQSIIARAGKGLTVLLGVGLDDNEQDVCYLVEKIVNLRIFSDSKGKMNLSLLDVGGELMIVSQFTLFGDCRKGRRPSFDGAAPPERAKELYDIFIKTCKSYGISVSCGQFQAHMLIQLENDGPVTILLDSKRIF